MLIQSTPASQSVAIMHIHIRLLSKWRVESGEWGCVFGCVLCIVYAYAVRNVIKVCVDSGIKKHVPKFSKMCLQSMRTIVVLAVVAVPSRRKHFEQGATGNAR
jgi:hypothetical protein